MRRYLASVVYSPTCKYDLGKLLLHEFQCLFFHIIIGRFDQYLLCISHRLFDVYILGRIQYDTYNSMQYVINCYCCSYGQPPLFLMWLADHHYYNKGAYHCTSFKLFPPLAQQVVYLFATFHFSSKRNYISQMRPLCLYN